MRTPHQIFGTVEKVSVEWMLANLSGFIDFEPDEADWMTMLSSKAVDTSTAVLVDRVLTEGFTIPVCLYEVDVYTDEDGMHNVWALGNGHHRVAAAILTCADEIPVYWSPDGDYMHSNKTTGGGTDIYESEWYSECGNMSDHAKGVHSMLREAFA